LLLTTGVRGGREIGFKRFGLFWVRKAQGSRKQAGREMHRKWKLDNLKMDVAGEMDE
jgi:hypothetical protein